MGDEKVQETKPEDKPKFIIDMEMCQMDGKTNVCRQWRRYVLCTTSF